MSKHGADTRRLVDMTAAELLDLVDQRLEEHLTAPREPANADLLDRAGAAKYLNVSVAQLDRLIREGDGPPYSRIGDSKRFDPTELKAWAKGSDK